MSQPLTAATPSSAATKRFAPTDAQVEVWLSSQIGPQASCIYNECTSLLIRGELNLPALERALQRVVVRNESLRATFRRDGREVLIHQHLDIPLRMDDWSNLDTAGQQAARDLTVFEEGTTPFDLENGPLFRARIQKLSETENLLTLTAHHLVIDGWSLWVIYRDLGHLYAAELHSRAVALPPACAYEDYAAKMAAYQAGADGRADRDYWVNQFRDSIPVLDLPTDRPRPALKTYSSRRFDHVIDRELVSELRKIGGKVGCSLFNTMLAGFQAFLYRISGHTELTVGIPTAGQAATDMTNLVGLCVNTLPVRSQIDGHQPMLEFACDVRSTMLDALDHQKYTFGSILHDIAPKRDPSRPPIIAVLFNVDPAINEDELGFEDLDIQLQIEPRVFENFELFINGVVNNGQVEFQCQYNSDLFDETTIAAYLAGYEALLRGCVTNPEQRIHELPILSLTQQQQMLVDWNATEMEYPELATLASEFVRQAAATPRRTAIRADDEEINFEELDRRTNRLARFLQSRGVHRGDLVGVCVDRSPRMIEGLLGILKAGAGYVPLDPAFPVDRLKYMCDDAGLKLLVTQEHLHEMTTLLDQPCVELESVDSEIETFEDVAIEITAEPSDIAYVIYTSGSTGQPKGVQVPQGAVVNFLYAMKQAPGFTQDDCILAVTTLSFDISVLEVFLPLLSGGCALLADHRTVGNGALLAKTLADHPVTVLQATPATFRMLIESGWQGDKHLRIFCGGEPMPKDLVDPLLNRCQELWNMYGPTETTVWSSVYRVADEQSPILIGRPVGNTQLYVLDERRQPVPPMVPGEVYIGGAGVTLGYRCREALTQERFVENPWFNPFANYVNSALYRTGDLARFRHDGQLEFLRRNDKQVKVRGFRIELGEIEQNLQQHEAMIQVAVIVREDSPGDTRLAAYYVAREMVTSSELRKHLRVTLPEYMIPQHFVELDAFPQTNNGKIDLQALPEPDGVTQVEFVAPETTSELLLARIWQDVLCVESVSVSDNFFDLGGHSLLVMRSIEQVEAESGIRLNPQDFLMGTLEQLSDKVESAGADQAEEKTAFPPSEGLLGRLREIWEK